MRARRGAIAGLLAMATIAAAALPAAGTAAVTISRLGGVDRYDTAKAIALGTYSGASRPVAVAVASGENFPDALAASYLAGRLKTTVLLSPSAAPSDRTHEAITALGSTGAVIVGGPNAVSANVETQLRGRNLAVERIGGGDRYETARLIAERFPPSFVGSFPGGCGPTAIIASGEDFPDALAAGPIAYERSFPLLLTTRGALHAQASAAMSALAIKHAVIVGGEAAVGAAVQSSLETSFGTGCVRRVGGANRQETATLLADLAIAQFGWSAAHVNLARGNLFPDALTGGGHGGEERSPILLTGDENTLSAPTQAWLNSRASTLTSIHVFGGEAAVSAAVAEAARKAAGGA